MADADKPKLVEWNLRGFPEELRAICQKIALDERSKLGKRPKDADVVARLLREALGLPQPPETHVIDSAYESGKGEIRRGSQQVDTSRTAEAIRNKTR
jgi:hypothetical protein